MTTLKQASLGDQVSKKISTWVLIFVAAIILLIFFVSLIQSLQMYNKQVSSWVAVAPRQAITNLIDSDDFSLNREVQLIESTGLFSSFGITDNQKRVIASFGDKKNVNYIPIYDEVNVIWGYYFYKSNFFKFISPFFYSGAIFLFLVTVLYCLIRGRMRTSLDAEFTRFNRFLNEIEKVTNQIHQVYIDELKLDMNLKNSFTNEQLIINRAVLKLLDAIKLANQSLREAILSSEQKKFEDELTRTALQVAHDIGSPLATLEAIVQSASLTLPEESRVAIRNAASKIRDITNSLLKKAKRDLIAMDNGELAQQMLSSLVSQIITEKHIQYQDNKAIDIHFNLNPSCYGLFAMVKIADFSRVLSNLINNGVESITSGKGNISIELLSEDKNAVILITDNGKGMSADIVSKLGHLGVTYAKSSGYGLGLFYAKTTIENWGGQLDIQSIVGQGTTIKISLPKSKPPKWFVPILKIMYGQTVVIIDDDESIHDIWKQRFMDTNIPMLNFHSPEDLVTWKEDNGSISNNHIYLCDYEFIGSNINGIDLINQLKINRLSILVTSRLYINEIAMRCEASGIKFLPKDMASIVPIERDSEIK